jgi:hypothetical protein
MDKPHTMQTTTLQNIQQVSNLFDRKTFDIASFNQALDSKIEAYQKWLPSAKIGTRFALAYSTCYLSEILTKLPRLGVKIVLGTAILGGSFAGAAGIIDSQRYNAIYSNPKNVAARENYARLSAYVTSREEFINELGQTCAFVEGTRSSLLCDEKLTAQREAWAAQAEASARAQRRMLSARAQSRMLNATMDAQIKKGCFYNEETGRWDGAWNC